MYLKSLEMHGFKSFPDKTVFEFGKGMTAVVGPNGSGKSNIADAVKWVLGEQSTKSLRGSKMEDVIFSGTGSRKALGYAEVTLKLDNSDRKLNRDDDEVAVTRRFYRSGDSEYKINGDVVRLRDVHELFMDTGLGRDGYSMVSQGKIEDMVSSKSQDRREMFEEAAGISHYRYRRADALRRLDAAEENLVRLRDILSELEARVGPLEKQSEKAQRFLQLASERKDLEIGLWLDILEKSAGMIREQNNKLTVAENQHAKASSALDEIFVMTEDTQAESRRITLQIEEIQKNSSSFDEQAVSVDGLIAVNENSVAHNNENIERIKGEKEQEQLSSMQIDARIADAEKEIDELNAVIEAKRLEILDFSAGLNSVRDENDTVSSEYSQLTEKLSSLTDSLSQIRIRYSSAQSSAAEISERLGAVADAKKEKELEVERINAEKEECEASVSEWRDKASELVNAVSGHSMRVSSKSQSVENLKFAKDKLSLDTEQIKSKIQILEDMEKNMEGYSGSVKAVMKAAGSGVLRGIHGPMSQLLTVRKEYSLAIETALGAAIQHIVTDDEQDAKRAMNYLKDTNQGRATFFPLTGMKSRSLEEEGLDDCYGYVDIASNIVEYDAIYDEVVGSQLGKTVIVEDIDCAISMAKKYDNRFKIVTLDGQVMNPGGAMTGGSKIRNAGFLTRTGEIESLKEELEADKTKLALAEADLKRATETLSRENADLEGARADLARAQEEKFRADSLLNTVLNRLAGAKSSLNSLSGEESTAAQRIEALNSAAAKALDDEKLVSAEIDGVQARLTELSSDRESLAAKREEINAKINELSISVASAVRDADNRKSIIASLEESRTGQEERLRRLDEETEEINNKNERLYMRIEELKVEKAKLLKQSEDARALISELAAARDECDKKLGELRIEERRKTEERENLAGEMIRLEGRKEALEKEQTDTENKLFEEYKLTKKEALQLEITLESVSEAKRELADVKSKIKALGSVNVSAIEEYREVSGRYEFMKTQMNDVEKSKSELVRMINELTEKMAVQFRERFDIINSCFSETFSQIFGGGRAELILEDENDILECGIEIKAQPPGKNVRSLSLLSGGEKGLCAIALLFAILKVTPAPFCIFDEVEAALDDVNVLRYAQYVRSMTDKTQFILITHRRGTMEEADIMYGVTMQEKGVSKILELKTAQMAEQLGLE